jgi:phospho-N-acetylmuramoyl-pentapeptide-transferase
MGDTGSLAIGGFVSAMAILLDDPIILFFVGFVYVAEVASVILQVGYFKMTHGKRIFKMAPIHHHFEMSGWSEKKIVTVFTLVNIVGCVIGVLLMRLD